MNHSANFPPFKFSLDKIFIVSFARTANGALSFSETIALAMRALVELKQIA